MIKHPIYGILSYIDGGIVLVRIAEVIVDVAHSNIDRVFDYYLDDSMENVGVGMRVLVPFGGRKIEGFIVKTKDNTKVAKNKMKSIIKAIDDYQVISENQLKLAFWMKRQYACLLVHSLRVMLPAQIRGGKVAIKQERYIKIVFELDNAHNILTSLNKAKKQKQIVEYLLDKKAEVKVSKINADCGASTSSINSLCKKQLISITKKRTLRKPMQSLPSVADKRVELTDEQCYAVEEILDKDRDNNKFLIHGVTGSGKTEVYMRLSASMLAEGKGVIILVPEISLTPQMVSTFRARFENKGAVLHSKLSAGERLDEWQRIRSGDAKIVIGARSAVFAPVTDLGLIVIDEEHETSYKSETQPRYDAIEVARHRCEAQGCTLLLGSATPTITRYYEALRGDYCLLQLKDRVGQAKMPATHIVDMREEFKRGNMSIISNKLHQSLEKCLSQGQKAILFLNRRGHSTHVSCRDCGYVLKCDNCDVTMTYHINDGTLRCHYCGADMDPPTICPECSSKYIKYFGGGTQKVEQEILKLFDGANVLRMDADTTGKKTSHIDILADFAKEDAQILIGTQMIAKGLDFHDVTLVGVIAADTSLYASDYRAMERTFQLVAQVAGRAGRGQKEGEVVIQTYSPDNFAIVNAAAHDYLSFYQEEINMRKASLYPPFAYYSRWVFSHEDLEAVKCEAENAFTIMKEYVDKDIKIRQSILALDVAPARLIKIKGRYRYQLLIKYYKDESGMKMLDYFSSLDNLSLALAYMTLEIDPLNMV